MNPEEENLASGGLTLAPLRIEDLFNHLPCPTTTEYDKGRVIYGPGRPAIGLYCVTEGTVAISRVGNGSWVVLEIYGQSDFFGEATFFFRFPEEAAVALERTKILAWTATDIQQLSLERPKLATALLQLFTARSLAFVRRMESFSSDPRQRLARALIRFGERFGTADPDGSSIRLPQFTHELLSRYVGSTREIVTRQMNEFRRLGAVRYSRSTSRILIDRTALESVVSVRSRRQRAPSAAVSGDSCLNGQLRLRVVAEQ